MNNRYFLYVFFLFISCTDKSTDFRKPKREDLKEVDNNKNLKKSALNQNNKVHINQGNINSDHWFNDQKSFTVKGATYKSGKKGISKNVTVDYDDFYRVLKLTFKNREGLNEEHIIEENKNYPGFSYTIQRKVGIRSLGEYCNITFFFSSGIIRILTGSGEELEVKWN